jgi:hypothetical protein
MSEPYMADQRNASSDDERPSGYVLAVAAGLMLWAQLLRLPGSKASSYDAAEGWSGWLSAPGGWMTAAYCVLMFVLPVCVGGLRKSPPTLRVMRVFAAVVLVRIVVGVVMKPEDGGMLLVLPVALSVLGLFGIPRLSEQRAAWTEFTILRRAWVGRFVLALVAMAMVVGHFLPLSSYDEVRGLQYWELLMPVGERVSEMSATGLAWEWVVYGAVLAYGLTILLMPWFVGTKVGRKTLWSLRVWATVMGGYALSVIAPYSVDDSFSWQMMMAGAFGMVWLTALPWQSRLILRGWHLAIAAILLIYLFRFVKYYAWGPGTFIIAAVAWLTVVGLFMIPEEKADDSRPVDG